MVSGPFLAGQQLYVCSRPPCEDPRAHGLGPSAGGAAADRWARIVVVVNPGKQAVANRYWVESPRAVHYLRRTGPADSILLHWGPGR
jgi:RNA polymerase subunit RPABC4/transcription elongation factor Spt4